MKQPVVIIDEPHRFARDQKAFKTITSELKPQMIIRYGATYPDITKGKGKSKKTFKDYNNLLYDLNAYKSFNQNLIKGVAKEHFEPISHKEEKVKIVSIESRTSATFQLKRYKETTKAFTLTKGDSLSIINEVFEGLVITGIGKNYIDFSNGQTKYQGEEFITDIYSSSYQEQMIRLAIQRHFETEKQNFCHRKFKIKTLALFFIDDIASYREKSENGKEPYLRNMFERLLLERIEHELANISEYEIEYRDYLLASKADINACHAGYFSQDNNDSDEEIAKEVDEILHNKKKLLSIKNEDGSYNTRRFLFSKWTLKEGWDNPNVFTIAKLRSSGSETSKLQEVGRGLRLPVDENGNRISNEEFKLNYIVDFTEADFAQKLINEINGELPVTTSLTVERISDVAKKLGVNANILFGTLLEKEYIDFQYNIIPENREQFFKEYPDFTSGNTEGKVIDKNKTPTRPVKIRKAVFDELKSLWDAINQKYYLFYDNDIDSEIPHALHNILRNNVFGQIAIHSTRDIITSGKVNMVLQDGTGVDYLVEKPLTYGEFLTRINRQTSIPLSTLHNAMLDLSHEQPIEPNTINEYSAANIVKAFADWKIEKLQGRFRYAKSNQTISETALTHPDGTPKDEIMQGKIGISA